MDIHYQGIWRMDWGFGNPNKTATLIVLLMVAIWTLPFIRRWLNWVVFPIFAGLGICLMHTMSRGGVVAALAGFGVILMNLPRPWAKSRVVAISIAVTMMLGGALALQTTTRFAQSYEDRSISNRFEIWKHVPQMMVDAPAGWGLGQSGVAFTNWYQPTENGERYRTLVNSHFTWLVEFGWSMRVLYVLAWAAVFVLCYPTVKDRNRLGFSIAFGLLVAFFVASLFSSVAEVLLLWALPVLAFVAVLSVRIRQRIWPNCIAWISGASVGCAILIGFYVVGCMGPARNIAVARDGTVRVGAGNPKLWVVVSPLATPNTVSLNYPRDLREYCKATPSLPDVGFSKSVSSIPSLEAGNLVIMGALPKQEWGALQSRAKACQKLIWVKPNIFPGELNLPREILEKTTVIFGEFSDASTISSWKNVAKCQQVEGVGDFFQHWPEVVFSALK